MSNDAIHRVLKYAGGSLIEVIDGLLPDEAKKLIDAWTDEDLSRKCKCVTLDHQTGFDPEEAIQSDGFATPYDVYSVENTLGIINVLAQNEHEARGYVQNILNEAGERTGSTLTIDNVIKTIDVHVVIDNLGVVMNQLTKEGLDEIANSPFEDA